MTRVLTLGLVLFAGTLLAADGPAPQAAPPSAVRLLEVFWPSHPESVAMLADILQGSRLGPTDGWFRKAVTKTRFDAKSMIGRFDKDGDGRISAEEFPGAARDFARLDRNRDGAIASADFDFSANALAPSPGMTLFVRADKDGDGKLTKAELDAFFDRNDSDGRGFLSLDDAKAIFAPPPPPPPANAKVMKTRPAPPAPPLTKWTLLKGWYRQEIGSLQPGPDVNAVAPDFTLKTVDGKEEITLSKLVGPKPVVLIFGNFTCGPFCSQSGNVQKLYERYKDRATFVMVYVREAHPKDGWVMSSNEAIGVSLRQPVTYEERVGVAQMCSNKLKFGMPMLVDTIDDTVGARYSGMPSRLYLIDSEGKVAFKNGRGPFGFKTAELENALLWMLNEPESSVATKAQ